LSGAELVAAVTSALAESNAVASVKLVGSRARGVPVPLSDWDFAVETDDFERLAAELPALVSSLGPIAQQWDPAATVDHCYMLMLDGGVKVDLIFDRPHQPQPPWTATAETLDRLDAHFWDWILWIAAKDAAGRVDLVQAQLAKLGSYLLEALGAGGPPESVEAAIAAYLRALPGVEERTGRRVSPRVRLAVLGRLREAGYRV
jgi:Nucleotidyltransferase domain